MKIKLNIKERILMGQLYPKAGDILTITIVKDLIEKVNLTPAEIKEIELKPVENGYQWDNTKDFNKEIDLVPIEIGILKKQIDTLDAKKELPVEVLDLCLKIRELKT